LFLKLLQSVIEIGYDECMMTFNLKIGEIDMKIFLSIIALVLGVAYAEAISIAKIMNESTSDAFLIAYDVKGVKRFQGKVLTAEQEADVMQSYALYEFALYRPLYSYVIARKSSFREGADFGGPVDLSDADKNILATSTGQFDVGHTNIQNLTINTSGGVSVDGRMLASKK
jgi:hypothetical protein